MEKLVKIQIINEVKYMSKKRNKELKRAEKRKIELERKRQKSKRMMMASVALIAIISIVVIAAVSMSGNDNITKNTETEPPPQQSQTEVRIPTSEIGNDAKFYEYDANGITVKYFSIRSSDGEIRVAFDACDVCYGAKKGYVKDGSDMRCVNCGNRYAISGLGTENRGGGCWPSYLPRVIDGDEVVIQKSDLENKAYMF
jgi:uncharacterized membrane protein